LRRTADRQRTLPVHGLPEIAKPQMVVYASRAPSWDMIDPALPSFPVMPQGGTEKAIADA